MSDPDPFWDKVADQLGSEEMQDAIDRLDRHGDQTKDNRS